MIKELWDGVSLQQFNNWKPLTGQINEIPVKYKNFYTDVNEWFETFALRAQNDWDAYLDFFLSRWSFQTLKDPNLKQMLIDMVFMTIEHWAFNRVPIEFFTNATNTLSNGTTYESNSPSFLNAQGLLPSRAKILANATSLKQLFHSLNEEDLTNEVDLAYFYTKVETDTLLTLQKQELENNINLKLNITDAITSSFQRVDNEDNPIGNQVDYGLTKNLLIKGISDPKWNPVTQSLTVDTLKEVPGKVGTVLNVPVENDTIDAISAGYAFTAQQITNKNVLDITTLQSLVATIKKDIKDRTPTNKEEYDSSPYWTKQDLKDRLDNGQYIMFHSSRCLIGDITYLAYNWMKIAFTQNNNYPEILFDSGDTYIDKDQVFSKYKVYFTKPDNSFNCYLTFSIVRKDLPNPIVKELSELSDDETVVIYKYNQFPTENKKL